MSELQIFENQEFGQMRVVVIYGKPYVAATDAARALGYKNPRDAVNRHCRWVVKHDVPHPQNPAKTLQINFIPEGDLYRLIVHSELPSAERFESWVFDEVLPQIRKTGGYVGDEEAFIRTYLPFADEATKNIFRATLVTIRKQNEALAEKDRVIEEQNKEKEYQRNVIDGLLGNLTLAEQRQYLNAIVRKKGEFYQERWAELYRQFEMKYHIDLDYRFRNYNETHSPKMKTKLDYIDKVMGMLPELYELACKIYEGDAEELFKKILRIA